MLAREGNEGPTLGDIVIAQRREENKINNVVARPWGGADATGHSRVGTRLATQAWALMPALEHERAPLVAHNSRAGRATWLEAWSLVLARPLARLNARSAYPVADHGAGAVRASDRAGLDARLAGLPRVARCSARMSAQEFSPALTRALEVLGTIGYLDGALCTTVAAFALARVATREGCTARLSAQA